VQVFSFKLCIMPPKNDATGFNEANTLMAQQVNLQTVAVTTKAMEDFMKGLVLPAGAGAFEALEALSEVRLPPTVGDMAAKAVLFHAAFLAFLTLRSHATDVDCWAAALEDPVFVTALAMPLASLLKDRKLWMPILRRSLQVFWVGDVTDILECSPNGVTLGTFVNRAVMMGAHLDDEWFRDRHSATVMASLRNDKTGGMQALHLLSEMGRPARDLKALDIIVQEARTSRDPELRAIPRRRVLLAAKARVNVIVEKKKEDQERRPGTNRGPVARTKGTGIRMCYTCQSTDHIAPACPFKFCTKCKGTGHYAGECGSSDSGAGPGPRGVSTAKDAGGLWSVRSTAPRAAPATQGLQQEPPAGLGRRSFAPGRLGSKSTGRRRSDRRRGQGERQGAGSSDSPLRVSAKPLAHAATPPRRPRRKAAFPVGRKAAPPSPRAVQEPAGAAQPGAGPRPGAATRGSHVAARSAMPAGLAGAHCGDMSAGLVAAVAGGVDAAPSVPAQSGTEPRVGDGGGAAGSGTTSPPLPPSTKRGRRTRPRKGPGPCLSTGDQGILAAGEGPAGLAGSAGLTGPVLGVAVVTDEGNDAVVRPNGSPAIDLSVVGASPGPHVEVHGSLVSVAASVHPASGPSSPLLAEASVEGKPLTVIVDTGAALSLIDGAVAADLGLQIAPGSRPLAAANGSPIEAVGTADVTLTTPLGLLDLSAAVVPPGLLPYDAILGVEDMCRAGPLLISLPGPGADTAPTMSRPATTGDWPMSWTPSLGALQSVNALATSPPEWADLDDRLCGALDPIFRRPEHGHLLRAVLGGVKEVCTRHGFNLFGSVRPDGSRFAPPCSAPPVSLPLKDGATFEPFRARTCRKSEAEIGMLHTMAEQRLDDGKAKATDSPYAHFTFLIEKTDENGEPTGKFRPVTDYRPFNAVAVVPGGLMPDPVRLVDAVVGRLRAFPYSFLLQADAMSAFEQLRLDPATGRRLAYTMGTEYHLEPTVLPFGPSAGPKVFSAFSTPLARLAGVHVFVDDFFQGFGGDTVESGLGAAVAGFLRLAEVLVSAGVTLSVDKLRLGHEQGIILGEQVDRRGRGPSPGRVAALRNAPMPETVAQARSLLGTCNFSRPFYAPLQMAHPEAVLRDAIQSREPGARLEYTEELAQAVMDLKTGLDRVLLRLAPFDPALPLHVVADAATSTGAVGYLLYQEPAPGRPHSVVGAGSRRLPSTRRRRLARLQAQWDEATIKPPADALAAVGAPQAEIEGILAVAEQYEHLITAAPVTYFYTDNESRAYLIGGTAWPRDQASIRALARLAPLGIQAVAVPADDYRLRVADYLSRLPSLDSLVKGPAGYRWRRGGEEPVDLEADLSGADDPTELDEEERAMDLSSGLKTEGAAGPDPSYGLRVVAPWVVAAVEALDENPVILETDEERDARWTRLVECLAGYCDEDPFVAELLAQVAGEHADLAPVRRPDGLVTVLSLITGDRVVYLPSRARRLACQLAHDSVDAAHGDFRATNSLLSRYFWWPGMLADGRHYAEACVPCQLARVSHVRKGLVPKPSGDAGRRWQLDVAFFDWTQGNEVVREPVLVAVDKTSKLIMAQHLADTTAERVAEAYLAMFDDGGFHEEIEVDDGPEFKGVFAQTVHDRGVLLHGAAPGDKESMGLVERAIGKIRPLLAKWAVAEQREASDLFPYVDLPGTRVTNPMPIRVALDPVIHAINSQRSRGMGGSHSAYELYTGRYDPDPDLIEALGLGRAAGDGRTQAQRELERRGWEQAARAAERGYAVRMAEQYNEARRAENLSVAVGDKVLRVTDAGGATKTLRVGMRNEGPYVVSALGPGGRTVSLRVGDGPEPADFLTIPRWSVRRLRRWIEPSELEPVPAELREAARLQRPAPAEPPTGAKKYSTYAPSVRRFLERRERARA